jgi:hypothetical protein
MTLRSFYRFVFVGTLYTFAAIAAIGVLASLTGFDLANAVGTWPIYILAPFMLICAFFAIGGMVLWLGMILDCAFVVKLPIWSRTIWLVLLVLTGGIVAYVYYFCVYKNRPSGTVSAELEPPAQS